MSSLDTNSDCVALENLINEFFHINTGNSRKQEIEQILNFFRDEKNSWSQCLKFLFSTESQFTKMYCLSVLENTVNKKWFGLSENKEAIRNTLWRYLIENHSQDSIFVRNKTCKILVDIARLDWPHFYPDFFSNIFHLIETKETILLGLILLSTAIEEFTLPKENLSAARKEELNRLLLQQISYILTLLNTIMKTILKEHINFVTATPPPSPTSNNDSTSLNFFENGCDLSNAFLLNLRRGLRHSNLHMDYYFHQISAQSLNCVCHIFTWIPANQHHFIPNNLLSLLCVFATFVSCEKSKESNSLKTSELGALALSCINELLSKKFVSTDAAQNFYHLFQNTFHLLQTLIKGDGDQCLINSLDEDYSLKIIEFLRLFIAGHFSRIEYHKSFPIVEFLTLLFQFTFKQKNCDRFLSLLEVWNIFIDIVLSISLKRTDFIEKYKSPLLSFASHVACKVQFNFNQNGLEELDDESLNDDNETELQHFINHCLETVVKVADLFPLEVVSLVDQFFQENMKNYHELVFFITKDENGKPFKLNISEENDIRRLHCSLRDLTISLKMLGHLSIDMVSEHFQKRFYIAKPLVDKLINSLLFINRLKLSSLETWDPVLKNDLVDVHSQLLLTIKAFVPWLSQFNCDSLTTESNNYSFLVITLVNECVNIVCNTNQYHLNIVHCAILCLHHVVFNLRSKLISNLESIQLLCSKFCSSIRLDISGDLDVDNLCFNLPLLKEDEITLCNIFSNLFILPWPQTSDEDQDWPTRSLHHSAFIQALSKPIINPLKSNPELLTQPETQECYKILLKRTLPLFSSIIYNHQESPNRSKQLLFLGLKEIFELSIRLLPTFLPTRDTIEEILELLLSGYDVLRSHLKTNYVENIVQIMLQEFSDPNQIKSSSLLANSGNNYSRDCQIIKLFFKILSLIVEQPYFSIKSLLPLIITLVLNQLYQLLNCYNNPDLNRQFFKFLHNLLCNNFKYFQKSSLINNFTSSINQKESKSIQEVKENIESKLGQDLNNEDQLLFILQAYGQSFLTSDIALFKQNLESMECLNNRLHLYSKRFFKEQLLDNFLNLFIETCITQSRELFQEDMLVAVYNLAFVDFDHFYKLFIHKFLINCEGLDDNQKNMVCNILTRSMVTDLPSFVKNLQTFVNDVRYFRIINNSLPVNSSHNV